MGGNYEPVTPDRACLSNQCILPIASGGTDFVFPRERAGWKEALGAEGACEVYWVKGGQATDMDGRRVVV